MSRLRRVSCGVTLPAAGGAWVRLPDGADVVCCLVVCPPMRAAIEAHRRESAADRHQTLAPLGAA
jgi:hypothetical protein